MLLLNLSQRVGRKLGVRSISSLHRTHTCGELNIHHVGETVQLSGWLQNTRRLGGVLFLALRDSYGVTQIKMDASSTSTSAASQEILNSIKPETIVTITGTVHARPSDAINESLSGGTGSIEVELSSSEKIDVVNPVDFSSIALQPQQLLYNTSDGGGGGVGGGKSGGKNGGKSGGKGGSSASSQQSTHGMASEELRLQYRHIDLRRSELQRNLKLRSEITLAARNHLSQVLSFTEVETPVLFKSTPEGAREFLVPTRRAGEFYALPQSPQQHKQLLMCGGIDRYYQVARCFRDESGRSDRQPEFTQLDMELAFVGQEDVMRVVESTVGAMLDVVRSSKNKNISVPLPSSELLTQGLPRMTFQEAMEKYGSDKPDVRYGLEIDNVTALLRGVITSDGVGLPVGLPVGMARAAAVESERCVRLLRAPSLGGVLSRREMKEMHETVLTMLKNVQSSQSNYNAEERLIVASIKSNDDGSLRWTSTSPAFRFLSEEARATLVESQDLQLNDIVILLGDDVKGSRWSSCDVMGWVRSRCAELLMERTVESSRTKEMEEIEEIEKQSGAEGSTIRKLNGGFNYHYKEECSLMWVVDFPLFEIDENEVIKATHHPFTSPRPIDRAFVLDWYNESGTNEQREALLRVQGQHYDLVCNGVELGGGSIRIHESNMQVHVLKEVLNLSNAVNNSFKHLTDALGHGCPPHGGECVVW